jgi:hypothetical protein
VTEVNALLIESRPDATAGPVVTLIDCTFDVGVVTGVGVDVVVVAGEPELEQPEIQMPASATKNTGIATGNFLERPVLIVSPRPKRQQEPSEGRKLFREKIVRARSFPPRARPARSPAARGPLAAPS